MDKRLFQARCPNQSKADGIIQFKGDKVIAFVHCKMRKALVNVSKALVHVALVQ